ncbi:hypothetical protein CWS43_15375 [Rahnella sp. AA]|uniref:hypothetical protein n=1 Tax=Rahnella sp. AA TaxID=2057180 RepID=UPI000C34D863|nr:hypothetical protein [Rahnella sp. AA]PKE29437.1 hypothetical protein CWS43_15375 [Rahnella sp. AA]
MNRRQFLAGSVATLAMLSLDRPARGKGHPASIAASVSLQFTQIQQQSTSLVINLVTGNLLNFSYLTLSGNQPNLYGNQVYLWEVSADTIPWSRPAQNGAPVLLNAPAGDQNIENVEISTNAYILGYSLAPAVSDSGWSDYSNVVACAYIPPGTGGIENREVAQSGCCIEPRYVGSTSLACYFAFLPGFQARSSKSWIGIWQGSAASYTVPPKWVAPVQVESDSGYAGMNGVALAAGEKYTLGLFSGGFDLNPEKCDLRLLSCVAVFST